MKHNIKTILVLIVIFLAIRCLLRVSKYSTDYSIKDVCKSQMSICKDQTKKKAKCMSDIKRACSIFEEYATKPVAQIQAPVDRIQAPVDRIQAPVNRIQAPVISQTVLNNIRDKIGEARYNAILARASTTKTQEV
jgi:hypothetical protein